MRLLAICRLALLASEPAPQSAFRLSVDDCWPVVPGSWVQARVSVLAAGAASRAAQSRVSCAALGGVSLAVSGEEARPRVSSSLPGARAPAGSYAEADCCIMVCMHEVLFLCTCTSGSDLYAWVKAALLDHDSVKNQLKACRNLAALRRMCVPGCIPSLVLDEAWHAAGSAVWHAAGCEA